MTCQHCQTWILDDDHRCSRCGRRVRVAPSRISPTTYPIAATATAQAYDFAPATEHSAHSSATIPEPAQAQQGLFATAINEARVIPFDSLTSAAERDAIRLRVAGNMRPGAVKSTKVKRAKAKRSPSDNQARLEFQGHGEKLRQPRTNVICDAPVAPADLRMQAALCDALLMACGCALGIAFFLYTGGHITTDEHVLAFLCAAILTVPMFYKLLWAFAGRDTPGLRMMGLELVDFDGKRPSKDRRYLRMFGSMLSLLAAGIGMAWALIDEDRLTWHDHISSSFPTFSDRDS
jgi:uncharacterized RDD family membrane protein YckC